MNLLCLSCGGEFSDDTSVIGTDGATIKCDHCGAEQPLYSRRRPAGSPESGGFRFSQDLISSADRLVSGGGDPMSITQETTVAPRSSAGASPFRKPMSSVWAEKRPADNVTQPVQTVPPPADSSVDVFEVPDLAASMPEIVEESSGGPYVVRSPAALVFEFPDFPVLEEWARTIDRPEKYFVQDNTGAEFQLGDFVRGHKDTRSRAGAIRNAMKIAGMAGGADPLGDYSEQLRDIDSTASGTTTNGGVSVSRQFEFKIEEEKTRDPRKLILGIVLGVAGVGIILGALFLLGVI